MVKTLLNDFRRLKNLNNLGNELDKKMKERYEDTKTYEEVLAVHLQNIKEIDNLYDAANAGLIRLFCSFMFVVFVISLIMVWRTL